MPMPILATKLYTPPPRTNLVLRPRLIERLNEGLHRKLTLISAPAGFGKTTLVSAWIVGDERPAAWLSLDEGDSDPRRFLAYNSYVQAQCSETHHYRSIKDNKMNSIHKTARIAGLVTRRFAHVGYICRPAKGNHLKRKNHDKS